MVPQVYNFQMRCMLLSIPSVLLLLEVRPRPSFSVRVVFVDNISSPITFSSLCAMVLLFTLHTLATVHVRLCIAGFAPQADPAPSSTWSSIGLIYPILWPRISYLLMVVCISLIAVHIDQNTTKRCTPCLYLLRLVSLVIPILLELRSQKSNLYQVGCLPHALALYALGIRHPKARGLIWALTHQDISGTNRLAMQSRHRLRTAHHHHHRHLGKVARIGRIRILFHPPINYLVLCNWSTSTYDSVSRFSSEGFLHSAYLRMFNLVSWTTSLPICVFSNNYEMAMTFVPKTRLMGVTTSANYIYLAQAWLYLLLSLSRYRHLSVLAFLAHSQFKRTLLFSSSSSGWRRHYHIIRCLLSYLMSQVWLF
jgi:hypothetical protein